MYWNWQDILYVALCYPIIQVLSTMRHELSHASMGIYYGLDVEFIKIFPSIIDGKWYFGYIQFDGPTNSMISLAPYYVNLVILILGLIATFYLHGMIPFFWWANFAVMFVVSPIIDTLYNLLKWKIGDRGDFKSAVGTLERQKTQ